MSKRDLQRIKETFDRLGVEIDLTTGPDGDVWNVQSATVVRHKALERLGAAAQVVWMEPDVVLASSEEAVFVVKGHITTGSGHIRMEWSVGEARFSTETNPGNYRVSGKQASYLWSMAEKRGKDRVILKLVNLHGIYSEAEADEFKKGGESRVSPEADVDKSSVPHPPKTIRQEIDEARTPQDVASIMRRQDVTAMIVSDPGLRDYAVARMKELGWRGGQ